MMMSKSQAQQTASPLFLDEEENDLKDVEKCCNLIPHYLLISV